MTLTLLIQAITALFPGVNYSRDYTVGVDGSGNAAIAAWNLLSDPSIGTEPTSAQLDAALASIELMQAKVTQVSILTNSYNAAGYANVAYMGTTFPCSPSTMLLLSSTLVQAATPQGLPSGFAWFDANGNGVAMTLTQLQGLGNAVFGQVYPAYVKLQGLIAQVYEAANIAAVQAVVWS